MAFAPFTSLFLMGARLALVHGRRVASIRDTGRHLNHAGFHSHRGRPIQSGADEVHAPDHSTGTLISIISPGGIYAYKFSS